MKEYIRDQAGYNSNIRKSWIHHWVKNSVENYQKIKDLFAISDCDLYVFKEYIKNTIAKRRNKSIILLGSGPSLNKILPMLKDWKGSIWCSSSQLSILEYHNIIPEACFILDADPNMLHLIHNVNTKNIPLITHPCMDGRIIEEWEGPIYFFRMYDPGDPYFAEYLPLMYTVMNIEQSRKLKRPVGLTSHIMNAGCVINAMIAAASIMEFKNIFLSGVDFGYPKNIQRFTNQIKQNGSWNEVTPKIIDSKMAPYVSSNNIKTDKVSIYYKYSTLMLCGMDAIRAVSISDGILTEIPWANPLMVIANEGEIDLNLSDHEIYKNSQKYLKKRDICIINTDYAKKIKYIKCCKDPNCKRCNGTGKRKYIVKCVRNFQTLKFFQKLYYKIQFGFMCWRGLW